jgi:hypothetical protein
MKEWSGVRNLRLKNVHRHNQNVQAFSLIEILTVLTLSAMILVATILIYSRVRTNAATITSRLESQSLPDEILQKIAEDIDHLATPGFDATVSIHNKDDNGYNSAQLIIENRYYGNDQPPKANIYERVVWQSVYDPIQGQLILYRSHSGLNLEDKIVDNVHSGKEEPGLFVPVCAGLTYFGVFPLTGDDFGEQLGQAEDPAVSSWQKQEMPNGILLGLSLSPWVQLADGSYVMPEENIVYRAVAVDRTRPIPYKFVAKRFDQNDPNNRGKTEPNEVGRSAANQTPTNTKTNQNGNRNQSVGTSLRNGSGGNPTSLQNSNERPRSRTTRPR